MSEHQDQRWRTALDRLSEGYAQLAEHTGARYQCAGLSFVADALEVMAEQQPVRDDARLAWVLYSCAETRAGEQGSETPGWPELEAATPDALRVLRDPHAEAAALRQAYRDISRTARQLGSSARVADRLADIWQHHHVDLSGKDQ